MDPSQSPCRPRPAAGVLAVLAVLAVPAALAALAAPGCTNPTAADLPAMLAELTDGRTAAGDPWSDPRWAALRDDPTVRPRLTRALRRHAAAHPVHEAVIATAAEPGERLDFVGRVVDAQGVPVAGALLFVYHADAAGRYAPEASAAGDGERNARLFAWLRTDERGECTIRTILPGTYGGAPPHFHFSVRRTDDTDRQGGGIYFEGGDWPIDPEIRSDAETGPAILVPVTKSPAETWKARATIAPRGPSAR